MRITYRPEGLSGSDRRLHAGNRILTFSPADLVRAVVTVGRENVTGVLQFGDLSELEIVGRTAFPLGDQHVVPCSEIRSNGIRARDDPGSQSSPARPAPL
ncbi:hypothetical protein [Longimicrobium sp.]|uniref:hypothetical protein n=1 Tax=Longimicrobium sp. TaxID=2029185 RepID=UPI002BAACC11|nr:hypothetical protein [Longimicrobium sp.]HSU13521.1 hypothetical protein [Longimicrobium sp.]